MEWRTSEPPTLAQAQAAGFPIGGEPLAVDLADTIVTVGPEPQDLLSDEGVSERFWGLHAAVLPDGWAAPDLRATRQLRDVVRALLDAVQQDRPPAPTDLASLNAFSARTSASLSLAAAGAQGLERHEEWHARDPADLALGAAARSTVELLTDPEQRARLRRCASPACSMLFVGGDRRRRFCAPNICGNRDRVARHYRRHRGADQQPSADRRT